MQKNYKSIIKRNKKVLDDFVSRYGCRVFSQEDYDTCIKRFGDIVEVDCGDFIPKSKLKAYNECKQNGENILKEEINKDTTGEGFIFEMCKAELKNRNYLLSDDDSIFPELMSDPKYSSRLSHGLELAKKALRW